VRPATRTYRWRTGGGGTRRRAPLPPRNPTIPTRPRLIGTCFASVAAGYVTNHISQNSNLPPREAPQTATRQIRLHVEPYTHVENGLHLTTDERHSSIHSRVWCAALNVDQRPVARKAPYSANSSPDPPQWGSRTPVEARPRSRRRARERVQLCSGSGARTLSGGREACPEQAGPRLVVGTHGQASGNTCCIMRKSAS